MLKMHFILVTNFQKSTSAGGSLIFHFGDLKLSDVGKFGFLS